MTVLPKTAEFALPAIWAVPLDLGFSIFPVEHRGKRPLGAWKAYQTHPPTRDQVRRWASSTSNVGIATGAVSGLLVLDLDSDEAVREAKRRGIPDTITVRTGKGLHVYFAHPGGVIGNRAGILPGVDIRGDGGYVVAPGSVHESGAVYAWENEPGDFGLAPPPAWLCMLLNGNALIDREAAKVRSAPAGKRNDQLNRSAFRVGQEAANGNIPPDAAFAALGRAALDNGLEPDEIEKTLGSGLGAGRRNPRSKDVSEDDVALAFTDRYRDTLRFDHDAGTWYEWDGTRWAPDKRHRAFTHARKIARSEGGAGKANFAAGVERFARADEAHAVNSDIWDADPFLLGTPGGTVDLRTGYFEPAAPGQFITKLTGCTPEHGAPELWLSFLDQALGKDADAIRFLQQWFGYCLTGDTREHALLFTHGKGGTGKSVMLNTLSAIMGDYATNATMDTFTASNQDRHSTELARLRGARLVTANETEHGRAWAEARIKSLTGGDTITARFMRQDNFEFRPQFKLTIVGNHAPRLANPDEAMRRRFNILGFNVKPDQPDLLLETKLRAEHGRILAWAIGGCRDWQKGGLLRPTAVESATAEYFAEEDLFGQWLAERCNVAPGKFEIPAKLYRDWSHYAEARGEKPGTAITFGRAMAAKGLGTKVSAGIRAHRGVELIPTPGGYDVD